MDQKSSKKLKLEWQKTDLSTSAKVKLWLLMKDNFNYRTWEKAIGFSGDFSEEEIDELGINKSMYKRLKNELRNMPLYFVETLPPDLKVWIFGLRPELKSEHKDELQTKDPLLQSIQNCAQADLANRLLILIKEWKGALVTPPIHELHSGILPTKVIEANPLFKILKEELTFPIWDNYAKFVEKMPIYFNACNLLREKIRESWKNQYALLTPNFEYPILRLISGKDKGLLYQLLVDEPHELEELAYQDLRVNRLNVLRGREHLEISYEGFHSRFPEVGQPSGATVRGLGDGPFRRIEHADCYQEILPSEYQKVADEVLLSDTASEAKRLYKEVKALEVKLRGDLQKILLG